LLALFSATFVLSVPAYCQDGTPDVSAESDRRPDDRRPNLLAALGLSPEQIQQIRRMNQERRPAMMEAQRRLREANRNLDMSIYGENVTDAEFQAKLKEFHAARAEVDRIRFESENSVRKLLTPEQLVRFRELRRRFAESRDGNFRKRGTDRPPPPKPANGGGDRKPPVN
jgi:Spy/CpxP family protein refolding chaperone